MSGANTDDSYKEFKKASVLLSGGTGWSYEDCKKRSAERSAVNDTYDPLRIFRDYEERLALEKAARQKETEPFSYKRATPRVDNCVPPPKSTEEMSAFEKRING